MIKRIQVDRENIMNKALKRSIKRTWLYSQYEHIRRLKVIKVINKLKKASQEEQIKLINERYEISQGHALNWENPTLYTEKMQWEKLYNKDPMKVTLTDKYLVREWVKEKIGEEYLIPLIGVWYKFSDIPFKSLPSQFVLKTNHGTGTNIIIKDKSKCNWRDAKRKIEDWMKMDFAYTNLFEMHYSQIDRKIIAEKYIESETGDLQDYKFLCFGGVPKFCWVDLGRYTKHTRTVFDMSWQKQPWTQAKSTVDNIAKPKNFEKMVEIVTKLCEGFSQVRVDLYNVDGKIYFGEITFTNGSGFDRIIPAEYDKMLGDLWELPKQE